MTRTWLHPRSLSLAACVITIAGATGCDPDDRPPNDRVETGLQQVLDQAVATPGVFLPGAIAHYRTPLFAPWSGSAGVRDLETGSPMRPTDRIRAGSILKTFVATVTLQHVEEGTLSLDQTLTELLPTSVTQWVRNADRITLRMLLNHTSGVPEWVTYETDLRVVQDPAHVWTTDEELRLSYLQDPYFEPGTSYRYSNTDYTLVGLVLDRIGGGKSWRAQVRDRVLSRLHLASTLLPEPGDRTVPDAYAHGYQDVGGTVYELTYVDPSMAGAAGGNAMVTTVQDLATFLDALLAGRLFAQHETLVEMTTMVFAPDETQLPHWYGLGLESYELEGTAIIGHGGGAAGYAAMMFRIPARVTTLVTAINAGDLGANAAHVLVPAIEVVTAPAH